jgi:hypothetical protein
MTQAPANEYQKRMDTLDGHPVGIESYKVGARYSARVDNVDPGAIIGRAQGATRREAEDLALESARLTLSLRDASIAMRRSAESLPKNRGTK